MNTTHCISTGILTSKAKDEIINSLATLMLVHTVRPKPADLNTMAASLARIHPSLKDTSATGFVSVCLDIAVSIYIITYSVQYTWKKKLRNKFKNLRAEKAGIVVPPPKKARVEQSIDGDCAGSSTSGQNESFASDLAEYESNVKHLQKVYKSRKWTVLGMSLLLDLTRERREKWVQDDTPPVYKFLEVFPCLQEQGVVSCQEL